MADIGLVVETPAEPAPFATGDGERTDPSSSPREAVSEDLSSGEEQSAAAALLGLHTAWPSSPDDESRDDGSEEHNPEGVAAWTSCFMFFANRTCLDVVFAHACACSTGCRRRASEASSRRAALGTFCRRPRRILHRRARPSRG